MAAAATNEPTKQRPAAGEKSSPLRPKNHDDAAGGRAANGHGRPDQLHAMRLGAHGGERLPRNGDTL